MSTFVVAVGKIDGEVRVAQVGTPAKKVAEFRIATDPGWYTVKAWEQAADKVPPSGSSILVTGRLSGRSYESDKFKDAEGRAAKFNVTEIVASTIEQIGAPAEEPAEMPSKTAADLDPLFAD